MDDTAADSQVMFSRPTTSGFGKCTAVIKTLVPDEVKDDFAKRARELGYPSDSDALREAVMLFTYGVGYLQKVHAERIRRMAENMASIGTGDGQ